MNEALAYEPYIGPRPFERTEQDRARFYGRDREADQIISLIYSQPVVLVYAQSGAGKTSLFNAQISPSLEEQKFLVSPLTRLRSVVPKNVASQEIRCLYIFCALLNLEKRNKVRGRTNFRQLAGTSLSEYIQQSAYFTTDGRQPRSKVLVIDQFEELFTFESVFSMYPENWKEHRDGFFTQVSEALEADPLLRVVFVIREDFLAQLDPFAPLLPQNLRTRFRLERLRQEAALSAVAGPIRNTGRTFVGGAEHKLVEKLLRVRVDVGLGESVEIVGEYVEPLQLQLVCQNLWRELTPHTKQITPEHIEAIADVNKVLADYYDDTVRKAAKIVKIEEARIREWCEQVLITALGTRGTVYKGREFTGGIPNTVIDYLENQHLIRAEWRAGARWYELTHDRFIEPIQKSNHSYFSELDGGVDTTSESQRALQLYTLGDQAWDKGEIESASEYYRQAAEIYKRIDDNWGIANAWVNLGFLNLDIGEYEKAENYFSQAQRISNEVGDDWLSATVNLGLGYFHISQGSYEQAEQLFDRSLAIYEEIDDPGELALKILNIAIAYSRYNQNQVANQHVEKAVRLVSRIEDEWMRTDILVDVGEKLFELQKYETAVKLYTHAIEQAPDDSEIYNLRGTAYWYNAAYSEAVADFNISLLQTDDPIYILNNRGHTLAEMGEYERAVEDLNRAIELGIRQDDRTTVAYSRNGLGLAYAGLKKFDQALKQFKQSVELEPDNSWAYFNRAQAYEWMGQIDKAIADYETSLEKDNPPLNPHKLEKAKTRLKELKSNK